MSSIEEFKITRLYRAFNTVIQLCIDRGYTIRHPSSVAEALAQPDLFSVEDGFDYDWFLSNFVITPQTAAREGGTAAAEEEEEEGHGSEHAEMIRRAMKGEWIAMRNAMRLSCTASDADAASAPLSSSSGDAAAAKEAGKNSKKGKQMLVFFSGSATLSIKEVIEFREKALKKRAAVILVVAAGKVGPAVLRDVRELSGHLDSETGRELLRIQVLEEETLSFNPSRHETVPQHIALTESEARNFLEDRNFTVAQLPRMLESDPMVQYLGLQRGDVVKIVRPSADSGSYEMYRQVI